MDKNGIIAKIYYDPAGHGSIHKTFIAAHKKDATITEADVKKWFYDNIQRKTDLAGYNSFITSEPKEEYQMDLMFFFDLKDPEFYGALLMVDSFSKYVVVIPIRNNKAPTLLEAMKEAITKMGGPPKTIYSDDEGGMNSKVILTYLDEHHIRHIMTRSHAGIAERTIRTIKAMLYSRIESAKERDNEVKRWVDVLYPVLLTYNHIDKHSATKMTPDEARKPQNHLQTKINLELKRVHSRVYPDVHVGDYVRIYKKKDKLDKERVPMWSKDKHRVERIEESMGQKIYYVPLRPGEGNRPKGLIRSNILLVS
jgi:Integrase core domain